jgi:16S rRNA (cytidine1402-2'-O)-methyltransferase
VLRELTKIHEQAARGTLSELCEQFASRPRATCVRRHAGLPPREAQNEDADDAALDAALTRLLAEGFSARDAASAAAAALGVKKKRAYQRTLELEEEE